MLDIFNQDAFSVLSLTQAINKLKHIPRQLSGMGLFETTSIATTTVVIEEKAGSLELVSPSARGGPGNTQGLNRRTLRSFPVPHFEINGSVMAEQVQGVRAFGSESALETVQGKIAEIMLQHRQTFDATLEYQKIGAVKGLISYADGSSLDLFSTFGVSQEAEVDFDLDNASPTAGALRRKCAAVVRQMQGILDGIPLQGIRAICSPEFFDDLIAHPEVRDTYLGYVAAQELRGGYAYGGFTFGGITFEEYRGSVGGTAFVAANKAHLFPVGVPGLFKTVYAPADYIETVNTLGVEFYAKQYAMPNGKGVWFDTQTNQLSYCTRPQVLIQAKRT
jgi:hypothetical protein